MLNNCLLRSEKKEENIVSNDNWQNKSFRNKYFKFMREISEEINPLMLNIVNSFAEKYLVPLAQESLVETVSDLVKIRASSHQPKLRPFLLALSYGATSIDELPLSVLKLGALVELINVSTYQANLVFDKKGKPRTEKEDELLSIASTVLQTAVFQELITIEGIFPSVVNKIQAVLLAGYREVTQGQYVDLHQIPKLGTEEVSSLSMSDFLKLYIKRCWLLGGSSAKATCIAGGLSSGISETELEALRKFGCYHGLALQALNDLADFVPVTNAAKSVGKVNKDQYSDLRNRKLTLPIYLAYHRSNEDDREYLNQYWQFMPSESDERLISILQKTQACEYSIYLVKEADRRAFNAIKSIQGDRGNFLKASLIVSQTNKFYRYFERKLKIPVQPFLDTENLVIKKILDEDFNLDSP